MAVVANVYRGQNGWLIDDLIQVQIIGGGVQLIDATTGQGMERGGVDGWNPTRASGENSVSEAAWATAQSTYGSAAGGVIRAQHLISSGKWAIHQSGPGYNVSPNN